MNTLHSFSDSQPSYFPRGKTRSFRPVANSCMYRNNEYIKQLNKLFSPRVRDHRIVFPPSLQTLAGYVSKVSRESSRNW